MRRFIMALLILALFGGAIGWFLVNTRAGQDWLLPRLVDAAMRQTPIQAFDGLRVFMCGTSSPLPASDRAQACVAVLAGDDLFLVDAGMGSANTMNLHGEATQNLRAILLTHFHSDHISGIYDFNLGSWVAGRNEPLVLIGPPGVERVAEGLNEAYALDRTYRVAHHGEAMMKPALGELGAREIAPGEIWNNEGLIITAFLVDHAPIAPAYGYRFDYKGRSVVVSGDSNVVESLVTVANGADLLLHDVLSMPIVKAMEDGAKKAGRTRQAKIFGDIQSYHAGADTLGTLMNESGISMLATYHFVPPPRNILMKRIFRRDLPAGAVLTHDGMVFGLPAGSDDIRVTEP